MPDKLQAVVITGIVTAIVVGGILFFAAVQTPRATDDAPILMAGGTFRMGASGIGKLDRDNSTLFHHEKGSNKKLKVFGVDLIEDSGVLTPYRGFQGDEKGRIEFTYCEDSACSGQVDHIVLVFDNTAKDYVVKISDDNYISSATEMNGVWDHPRAGWVLHDMTLSQFSGAPNSLKTCPTGKCSVIVRTCKARLYPPCP
jgi:hypothetical protein